MWALDMHAPQSCAVATSSTPSSRVLESALPHIIEDMVDFTRWSPASLLAHDLDSLVTVSASEHPFAPIKVMAESNASLIRPAEFTVTLHEAIDIIRRRRPRGKLNTYVRFVSLETLPELGAVLPLEGVRRLIGAGARVQANNILIGDGSLHSDIHFDDKDNILLQLAGEKEILLLPPVHLNAALNYTPFHERRAVVRVDGGRRVMDGSLPTGRGMVENHSPFSAFASTEDQQGYDRAAALRQLIPAELAPQTRMCSLQPGQALFIPALWSHAVRSKPSTTEPTSGLNVAVNTWYDRSMHSFMAALRASPSFAAAHTCTGSAFDALGRHAEAAAAYEAALSFNTRGISRGYPIALALAGTLIRKLGSEDNLERASMLLEELCSTLIRGENSENAGNAAERCAQEYASLGAVRARSSRFKDAIRLYSKAIQLKPNDALIYQQLARAYEDGGLPSRAVDAHNSAFHLSPNDSQIRRDRDAAQRRSEVRKAGGWSRHMERRMNEAARAPSKQEL